MKFKYKRREHRGRSVIMPDQVPKYDSLDFTALWKEMRDGEAGFTPFLNAGLTLAMNNAQFEDKERVHIWLLRNSWGNWSSYAVEKDGMEVAVTDENDHEMVNLLLFGVGACPFCGEVASGETSLLPKGFRWHRACLGRAYAGDALRFGGEMSKKWGAELLAELADKP